MLWRVNNLLGRSFLHDHARIHHQDPLRNLCDCRDVVCDEDKPHTDFVCQSYQQVQYF
jgi:hypothetical protein